MRDRKEIEEAIYTPTDRIGWWGAEDKRPRCLKDKDKVVFFTEEKAEQSAEKANSRGAGMSHYQGKCGYWHIGHKNHPYWYKTQTS